MHVLITGGGGFIGSHLVADQVRRGHRVRTIDLNPTCLKRCLDRAEVEIIEGDIRNADLLKRALAGIDVVFHLAGAHLSITTPEREYWEINVNATRSLVVLSHAAGVRRFVHCSSVGIYGEITQPPATEESPCRPDLVYERTKLEGEKAIWEFHRQTGYPVTVIRPVWVYGPGCARTAKLFKTIRDQRFVFVGNGETLRHCVYIDDLIEAFQLCADVEAAIGHAFIIGDSAAITVKRLVEEIAAIVHVPPPKRKVPPWVMSAVCVGMEVVFRTVGKEPPVSRRSLKFFTNNTAFQIDKAKRVLQFLPRMGLTEGLQYTYGHLLREGTL